MFPQRGAGAGGPGVRVRVRRGRGHLQRRAPQLRRGHVRVPLRQRARGRGVLGPGARVVAAHVQLRVSRRHVAAVPHRLPV